MAEVQKTQPVVIQKATGQAEPFDRSKLLDSLLRAKADETTAIRIVDEVEASLKMGMTTEEIYQESFDKLESYQRPIAARYSLRRALAELGPDGFPFEKYVAEIFRARGYEAITNQFVKGYGVEHEIDVVAWKDDELIFAEVKFHNENGIKSDLKVALYVKARFDDLKHQEFEFGGKKRTLTQGWLVTNTKFSEMAINYGKCASLTMVGWNFPISGNLQDQIEHALLHPLSCLTTLTPQNKKDLYARGVVLCKSLRSNFELLTEIGIPQNKLGEISEEIHTLCE